MHTIIFSKINILPLVITALKALEEPTGCDGIVEWGAIGNVGDLQGIINILT
jgi:hypothetical protein